MKFRKEIIIFSLILIFLLISAVSAEENITIGDVADSSSDYIEVESDQGYGENNITENPVLDDDVMGDDENISQEDIEQDTYPGLLDERDASAGYGFKGLAYASASFNKNIPPHKSYSCSDSARCEGADVGDAERGVDMLSNSQSRDFIGAGALNYIHAEDIFAKTCSDYREYFNHLKLDSLENLIEENRIGDVFKSNIHIIDFITANYLKCDLIYFMDAGAKYVDFSIVNLIDVNAFSDILDKIMNFSSTNNVMANIPSSNYNPILRNDKYYSNYSDYGLCQDAVLIINSHNPDDEMELFMESDSNISDMLIQDNLVLMNQTSDVSPMPDVCIDSFDGQSDLQLSDDVGCWSDAQDNSDKTAAMQSFKFSQQIDCLSSNMSEDIQHTSYHLIGCECTNTTLTKQNNSYDNLPRVSEFDAIASAEQEDNHDCVLFKKFNVNSPFIVENTSIFALFGVIKITIP